eukprot:5724300-Amphidinium_carterae.1
MLLAAGAPVCCAGAWSWGCNPHNREDLLKMSEMIRVATSVKWHPATFPGEPIKLLPLRAMTLFSYR